LNNCATGIESFIGGGELNSATESNSSVVGGCGNQALGQFSFIGGGQSNCALGGATWGTISGGKCNLVAVDNTFIGGGEQNKVYCFNGVVAGGSLSINCGESATISGGRANTIGIGGRFATLSGGSSNNATGQSSFIGSGKSNTTSALYSTLVGGQSNDASGCHSFIGSGLCNVASGGCSFIGGGQSNKAIGAYSGILGGVSNCALCANTFVVGSNIMADRACTTYVNDLIVNTQSANAGCAVCFSTNGLLQPFSGSNNINRGLFAQTATSTAVTNTTTRTSIITTGQGSLSVPANGFSVGSSFVAFLSGTISSQNNATIELHFSSGGVVLVDTGLLVLAQSTSKNWQIIVNFTIRAIGGAGVASIASSGNFTYNKDSANIPKGLGLAISIALHLIQLFQIP
jgi:hypothetical protein